MKIKILMFAGSVILLPVSAFSQDTRIAQAPAVTTPQSTNPAAPVRGKNSFTEAQARERMEKAGFTNVTGLMLTDDGVWEASAMKGTGTVKVQLDYQGNVTSRTK